MIVVLIIKTKKAVTLFAEQPFCGSWGIRTPGTVTRTAV